MTALAPEVVASLTTQFAAEHAALAEGKSHDEAIAAGRAAVGGRDAATALLGKAPQASADTREAARARIDALMNDKDFGARLLDGDHKATAEWNELHAAVAGNAALDDLTADTRARQHSMAIDAIGAMHNLPLDVIAEAKAGGKVSAFEQRLAQQWKDTRSRDADFVKKYLSGDPDAGRDMALANLILSAPVDPNKHTEAKYQTR